MTIAKRVREFRYAKGWGPDELASRAEISRTALYQIECGKTEVPRAGTLKRIAHALDISIEALLGNEDGAALDLAPYRRAQLSVHHDRHGPGSPETRAADRRGAPGGLHQKLDDLLSSPLADSITQIVVESHRLLSSAGTVEHA